MEICNRVTSYVRNNNLDKYSYTILIYDYKSDEILNLINKKIENVNKKSLDGHKKKIINET